MTKKRWITRRRFLLSLGACVGGGAYMRYLEPRWLRVTRVELRIPGVSLSRPIRILHLSDLHASEFVPLSFIDRAVALGIAEKPDLICLTGDIVTTRIIERSNYVRILGRLSATAPAYACLGNHDGGAWAAKHGGYGSVAPVTELLAEAGIACLENRRTVASVAQQPIEVAGVGDFWAGNTWAEQALDAPVEEGRFRIVLNHNPDAKVLMGTLPWHLMLCGHTHGGQLRLPWLGTPFAPVSDHAYVAGLNPWRDRWIHTTRGVGNLLGMRFNCPPEVSVIEICQAAATVSPAESLSCVEELAPRP